MSWRTCLGINKSNPIQSFLYDHNLLKQQTFLNWSVLDVLFIQTQRNYSIQISLHKKIYNATWVRIASFWKEAVLVQCGHMLPQYAANLVASSEYYHMSLDPNRFVLFNGIHCASVPQDILALHDEITIIYSWFATTETRLQWSLGRGPKVWMSYRQNL